MYFIIPCYRCGNLLIMRMGQKTKRCSYCNQQLSMSKVRILRETSTSREATRIIKQMKLEMAAGDVEPTNGQNIR